MRCLVRVLAYTGNGALMNINEVPYVSMKTSRFIEGVVNLLLTDVRFWMQVLERNVGQC